MFLLSTLGSWLFFIFSGATVICRFGFIRFDLTDICVGDYGLDPTSLLALDLDTASLA